MRWVLDTKVPLSKDHDMPADDILTPEEVGKILGDVDIKTLRRWRYERRGPTFFSYNHRTVRYRRGDVEAWIAAREEATRTVTR